MGGAGETTPEGGIGVPKLQQESRNERTESEAGQFPYNWKEKNKRYRTSTLIKV